MGERSGAVLRPAMGERSDAVLRPAMADITHVCRGYFLASDAMVALTILSGSRTGSPRLILSTFSIPSTTLPHAVYWLSRKVASPKQMKNWLSPELGSPARA